MNDDYKHVYHLVTAPCRGVMLTEEEARRYAGDFAIEDAHRKNISVMRTSVKQKATTSRHLYQMPLAPGYVQITTRYC